MKQRDTLKELNEQHKSVIFPVCNPNFDSFKSRLRKVIEGNFDYPVANTLEYDCNEKKFFITLTYGSTLAGPLSDNCTDEDRHTGFKLSKVIGIDPAAHLTEQINSALRAHEVLKDRHHLIQILLNEHLGKE